MLAACGGATEAPEQKPEPGPECRRDKTLDAWCGEPGYVCFKSHGPAHCREYDGPGGSPVYTYRVCCGD